MKSRSEIRRLAIQNPEAVWREVSSLHKEVERLRQTLSQIRELTGPPKMSETMSTAFMRLSDIRLLTDAIISTEGDK